MAYDPKKPGATEFNPTTGKRQPMNIGSPFTPGFQLETQAPVSGPGGQIKMPPAPTQPEAPTQPQQPKYGSQAAFGLIFSQLMAHSNKLQGLQDQKNKLLLQLYDRPLLPEELRTLSPSQQEAIQRSDKSLLEYQIMSLNDAIKGRTNENNQALQYMMEGYQMDQAEVDRKKTQAYNTTMALINKFGDLSGISQESRDLISRGEMPTQTDLIKLGKTLRDQQLGEKESYQFIQPTEQFGGGTFNQRTGKITPLQATGAGAPGSSLALNNPLGIKPGGKFTQYNTLEEGLQAGVDLIERYKKGAYGVNKDTSLMDFSSVWITGKKGNYKTGYTGEDVAKTLGVPSSTKIGQVDSRKLAEAVANFESPGWNQPTQYDLDTTALRIARQAFGTGRSLSDKDVALAQKMVKRGVAQGKSELDMLFDTIGFTPKKNVEFGKALLNALLPALTEQGLASYDTIGLTQLLNNDNLRGAVTKVENTIMARVKKETDDFVSEATVTNASRGAVEIAKQIQALIAEGTSPVGVVKGTMQQWLGKLKSPVAQKILADRTGLYATFRNSISGAAVTEYEGRWLEPLIPDLNETPDNFLIKLQALSDMGIRKLNAERSLYDLPQLNLNSLLNKDLRIRAYESADSAYEEYLKSQPKEVEQTTGQSKLLPNRSLMNRSLMR